MTAPGPVSAGKSTHAPIRIGLWGNFGTLNLGNECTLGAAIDNLRRLNPGVELLCICPEPADVRHRHGIPAVPLRAAAESAPYAGKPGLVRKFRRVGRELRAWYAALQSVRKVDALMIVGTGVVTDDDEGAFGLPYELLKWSVVAKLARRRLLYVSVGVEGITSGLARGMLRGALALADYRSYRDEHSRRRLVDRGFPVASDPVFPDLAFSLAGVTAPAGRAPPRTVAVGIYNYRGCGTGGAEAAHAYQQYLAALASFVLWLFEQGYAVRIVIGDYAYDEAVRLDLRAELQARDGGFAGRSFEDTPAQNYEQVLDQLAAADLVVATRFHNVLLALLLGRPVVSVSYDAKNDALMAMMGLERYCQSIETLSLERLREQFSGLVREAPVLHEGIVVRGGRCRAELDQQYTRLLAVATP